MKNFTTKEAFPLLTVSVESWSDTGELTLKISQSVFQVKGSKIDLKLKPLLWQVPISIRTSGSTEENRSLLTSKSTTMSLTGIDKNTGWVHLNPDQKCYYLVRYSEDLMDLISKNLWHNLSIIDRQTFIHSGYLSSSRKNQAQDYDPKTYVEVRNL